jgi:ubiquinone/menaquinone biosynthesis C-methylase UbiE
MADLLFADAELAALYDAMNPGREDYDFYRPMVMAAHAVLDVGCGTGSLLHEARDAGHSGRLCGLGRSQDLTAGGFPAWGDRDSRLIFGGQP